MKFAVIALALSIFCRSLAFVFAKLAAIGTANAGLAHILINPWYWAEILAFGGQTVFWIFVLRRMPLGSAYPAISLVYALNLAWSAYLFEENVTSLHILGIAVIMLGTLLTVPKMRIDNT